MCNTRACTYAGSTHNSSSGSANIGLPCRQRRLSRVLNDVLTGKSRSRRVRKRFPPLCGFRFYTVLKYRSDSLYNGGSIKFTLQRVLQRLTGRGRRVSRVVSTAILAFDDRIQDHQEISLHNTEWSLHISAVLIVCNYAIHRNPPQHIDTKRRIVFRSIVHYIAIEYETTRLCNTILRL